MRCWSDETGAIVGWVGPENYIGQRTYAFSNVVEADLVDAHIIHRRWANAFLRLADGTSIEESQPAAETDLLVSVDGTGPPEAA
jgi:hypothetical protein